MSKINPVHQLDKRFWLLYCQEFSKQHLSLVTNNTMEQETILYPYRFDNTAALINLNNTNHLFKVKDQLQYIVLKN